MLFPITSSRESLTMVGRWLINQHYTAFLRLARNGEESEFAFSAPSLPTWLAVQHDYLLERDFKRDDDEEARAVDAAVAEGKIKFHPLTAEMGERLENEFGLVNNEPIANSQELRAWAKGVRLDVD
jgi:hypothetical protein